MSGRFRLTLFELLSLTTAIAAGMGAIANPTQLVEVIVGLAFAAAVAIAGAVGISRQNLPLLSFAAGSLGGVLTGGFLRQALYDWLHLTFYYDAATGDTVGNIGELNTSANIVTIEFALLAGIVSALVTRSTMLGKNT